MRESLWFYRFSSNSNEKKRILTIVKLIAMDRIQQTMIQVQEQRQNPYF